MKNSRPHITVASVVTDNNRYLLVEERDKQTGQLVFNQPAGHLEPGESLVECAVRETLEETGWQISVEGIIGVALYTAPSNGVTYYRTSFLAQPLGPVPDSVLDPDIHAVHWMDYEEMKANSARMRSPLVLATVERHRQGTCFPLDLIYT